MYFTIKPSSAVGFTDQLLTFSSFYKLGRSLGLKYVHTPLTTRRSPNEIYDFLGFNQKFYWKNLLRRLFGLLKYKTIDLVLSEKIIKKNNIQSLEQLKKYIEIKIKEIKRQHKNRIIVCFKSELVIEYLNLVEEKIPYFPDHSLLYNAYIKYSPKYLKTQLFKPQEIKIFLHIRLGDTAIVRTPWNTVIPTWRPHKPPHQPPLQTLTEFDCLEDSGLNYLLELEEYYHFFEKFLNSFPTQNFSAAVFSDGYKRSLERFSRMKVTLDLPDDKIQAIQQKISEDNDQRFKCFQELNHTTCIIGEDKEKLYQLVDASLTADIIIIGTQQKMIPKLLSCYGNPQKRPIVILLGKQDKYIEDYQKTMYLSSPKATIIPVNLTSESFEDNLKTIVNEIRGCLSIKF